MYFATHQLCFQGKLGSLNRKTAQGSTCTTLGSPAERAALREYYPPPPTNSQTSSLSEVGKAVLKSSQQRVLFEGVLLNFL